MNAVLKLPLSAPDYPALYTAARAALFRCDQIDECQEWANKANALASYAKQSQDESLKDMAIRIQARAARRCGELLKAQEHGRTEVANAAGLTRLQRNQAVAIAQIPSPKFDALVDREKPPRVYQLAAIGTIKRYLSRTNKARADDLRAELKRLENKRISLLEKLERTRAQIAQAEKDLAEVA